MLVLGVSLLQWWKQSLVINQLTMRDHHKFRETFLFKLSQNNSFSMFQNVLLVGSHLDLYVPLHSALIEDCKTSVGDSSTTGSIFRELISNINEGIVASSRHTTVIKFTVQHSLPNVSRAQQMTGRPTHVAVVDDDTFVEKLMMISAGKYFQ